MILIVSAIFVALCQALCIQAAPHPLHITVAGVSGGDIDRVKELFSAESIWREIDDTDPISVVDLPEINALGLVTVVEDDDPVDCRVPSDCSFCFLDSSSLSERDLCVRRIVHCLETATVNTTNKTEESRLKPVFLVYEGRLSEKEREKINELVSLSVSVLSSLSTPDRLSVPANANASVVSPRLILLPLGERETERDRNLSPIRDAVLSRLSPLLSPLPSDSDSDSQSPEDEREALRRVRERDRVPSLFRTRSRPLPPVSLPPLSLRGVDRLDSALSLALSVVDSCLKERDRERRGERGERETGERLRLWTESVLSRALSSLLSSLPADASEEVVSVAETRLFSLCAERLKPFLSLYLQVLVQGQIADFNKVYQDDLTLSPLILDELRVLKREKRQRLRREAMDALPRRCATPRDTPSSDTDTQRDTQKREKQREKQREKEREQRLSTAFGSVWVSAVETVSLQLDSSIEDFLSQLEVQLKVQGVLSRREGVPVDLSLHLLVAHPLGRDHRQDPLLFDPRDRGALSYNEEVAVMQSEGERGVLVSAERARERMRETDRERHRHRQRGAETEREKRGLNMFTRQREKRETQTQRDTERETLLSNEQREEERESWFSRRQREKRSEWSREMLMFPLSVKNPETALVSSAERGGRQKKGERQRLYEERERLKRERLTPERLLSFSVLPALSVAEQSLLKIQRQREAEREEREGERPKTMSSFNRFRETVDLVLSLIPGCGYGHYPSPPISFGPEYNPV